MEHGLGRVVDHDPASRSYLHAAAGKPLIKKSTRWTTHAPVLDQGQASSCTVNAMAQWINTDYAARARQIRRLTGPYLTEANAMEMYPLATRLDGIPDNTYPPHDEGSSGLGAAKAAKHLGYIVGYGWTFSLSGFLAALQTQPLIVGTAFYADMEDPNSHGLVQPTGELVGGHEYLVLEVDYGFDELEFENSWSDQWGVKGRFRMKIETFGRLLADPDMPGDVTAPTLKAPA